MPSSLSSVWPKVRIPLLDLDVTPLSPDRLLHCMGKAIAKKKRFLVANHNLHSAYLHETDAEFAVFYKHADVILTDGFPIALAAGIVTRTPLIELERVGTLDWIYRVHEISSLRKIAVVGSTTDANRQALQTLKARCPGIEFLGIAGEAWNAIIASKTIHELGHFQPDLVLVGLGMPLQEKFLHDSWERLPDAIYATVGGAIDQISGNQRPAPRILGKFGVEWIWRLATQPIRLGHRYLIEPWLLARALISRHMGARGQLHL